MGLWVMGYGLWVMGDGVMGDGLWVMGYGLRRGWPCACPVYVGGVPICVIRAIRGLKPCACPIYVGADRCVCPDVSVEASRQYTDERWRVGPREKNGIPTSERGYTVARAERQAFRPVHRSRRV